MPRVNITQEDIQRSKLLKPGWYPVLVKNLEEKAAKTDGSALYVYNLIVESPDPEVNSTPLQFQVSEKAIGMATPLLKAAGWTVKAGSVELNDAVGRRCEAYVQRDEYQGRPQNKVVDFRPRSGVGQSAAPAVAQAPTPVQAAH